jgi:hypothetical protein
MTDTTIKQAIFALAFATVTVAIIDYIRWILDGAPGG